MRIALNLLYLLPGIVGGTQTYAVELIRALAGIDTENEYVIFLNRESANLELVRAPNFERIICPVRATRRAARYAWEQGALPAQLQRARIDLLHSLGYVGPLLTHCPHVVSIHDLIYRGHQEFMTTGKQKALEFFVKRGARRANCILAMSEFSKSQIVEDIGVNPQKVVVTYEAASRAAPAQQDTVDMHRYGITGPYVIAFSSFNPVKNIPRLIAAFSRACADLPHQLVLVGHVPEGMDFGQEAEQQGLNGRVVAAGYVPDEHVAPLLRGAELFAFPSRYEGFGLPILDAQQLGVPIACSHAASLPEVAGDGALFFDPASVEDMGRVLRLCLVDPALRAALVARGHANSRRFTWENTARQTLGAYQRVVSEPSL